MGKSATSVRFAVVGDIHVTKDSAGSLRGLFAQAGEAADALLLCGDLTDYGTADEARVLVEELSVVKVPIVAVLGNHDYESGTPEIVCEALTHAGVRVLDGEACEIEGVGIALLHYAPIVGTVTGEPPEIFPFLGSSRLEEPLLRYPVDAVFHGHAHRGSLEGRTIGGTPVYNVAKPLLQRSRPGEPPFRLYEVPREAAAPDARGTDRGTGTRGQAIAA